MEGMKPRDRVKQICDASRLAREEAIAISSKNSQYSERAPRSNDTHNAPHEGAKSKEFPAAGQNAKKKRRIEGEWGRCNRQHVCM